MRPFLNCTAALLALTLGATLASAQNPAPGAAMFRVFSGGHEIGVDRVLLSETPDGWTIVSTGGIGEPVNLTVRKFQARYDAAWKPLELTIDASIGDEPTTLHTTFDGTTATNQLTQGVRQSTTKVQVSSDAIILPNHFYSAYEALAVRLASLDVGGEIPVYVAPQIEVRARVTSVSTERMVTPAGAVETRRQGLTFANPNGPLEAVVWTDATLRLVRLHIPSASLEVVRDDVASVGVRTETSARAGDEQVNVPANGFNIAATVSKPASAADRKGWPGIVLVPDVGAIGRDAAMAGVPIFAELASALADAGFLVVRYDKRGAGQSGGRTEAAGLGDFADDVRSIVKYLDARKDVDDERIGVIGHGEGAWVALIAASREKRIRAIVLTGAAATTGAELILEQQRQALEKMSIPDAEKQAKIYLQKKIQAAVLSGSGWEGIPDELRRQADTPWFASFLAFDPARVMQDVRQPILILHGELDRQVPVLHADKLGELARTRKKGGAADVVKLPGINHLLVPATTGSVAEYATLKDKHVSPQATSAIADWFRKTLPAKP
jgi:pimeloyl-ACP methyl ester carboxylesterase